MDRLKNFDTSTAEENSNIEIFADVNFSKHQQNLNWKLTFKISDPQKKIIWSNQPNFSAQNQRADLLWQKTCFEMFFRFPDQKKYYEMNLNDSGQWNIYTFENYRNPETPTPVPTGNLTGFSYDPQQCALSAEMNLLDFFKDQNFPNNLLLNFTAVIKLVPNKTQYWAITHATKKPDFHDQHCFTLQRTIYAL